MATDLFQPADGLRLLGQHGGGGYDGRRFLVGRSDGEVIQLPLLPYLIMAAIAEGGVDGGWSADQIGDRVGTASGQGLTADTVRDLVAGTLAPLGLVAPDGADRPADAAGPKQPPGRMKPPYRRRRWGLAVGGAAVLVCVAATAPIMAETGTGETGRTSPAQGRRRPRRRHRHRLACSRSCRCSPPSCRSGWWPSSARPARVPACRCAEPRSASPRLPPGPPSSACWTLNRASTGRPR
jgi:hypothetical protein